MKVNDLTVADCEYTTKHDIPNEIRNLNYPQKYLLLEIGNEIESLEVSEVTDTAFYLRIVED